MKNQFYRLHSNNLNHNLQGLSTIQQIEKQEKQILQKNFMEQQLQWYGSLLEQIEENNKKKEQILVSENITYEYVKQRLNRKQQQISPLDSLAKSVTQSKKYNFNQSKQQITTQINSFSHSNNSQEQIYQQSLKLQPIIYCKK
ncbi:Hypothetical_protein [Hexamita inflata]|uniref:Hypothetical_protein n=1 Tax=Hexamita inflata TaxID=28002 RepID=A0AA86TCJ7_9EUKA|nr:Hypothetical protein HINF_LOCUS2564 [Hexamita inflata]